MILFVLGGLVGVVGLLCYLIYDLNKRLTLSNKYLTELISKHNALCLDTSGLSKSLLEIIVGYNELIEKHNLLVQWVDVLNKGNSGFGGFVEGDEWKRGYTEEED